MRWTTKHFWVAALGAGLIIGPAWAQSSRQSDDDSSSTRSSRQYDDDSDSYSSGSSRTDRSGRTGSSDSDYGEGRTMRSNQSQRGGSQASSRTNRDDDSWGWGDSDRSSANRSSRSQARTRQSNQSDDSWFGFDSGTQRSSRSNQDEGQWSNWDSEKDIRESGVWRVGNLLGKEVRNSQGEDLGAIEDIVIDLNNRNIRYVAISHGGMLGVGEKLFAVPVSDLREQQDEDGNTVFVLNVDARALENAQGFENRDRWPAQADNSFRASGTQMASRQSASSREAGQMMARGGQQTRSFQGEFEEFDEDANQITVRTSDGRRRVYNVSPSVRVTHQGRRAFLDELEEGDQISLSYTTSGDNRTLITSISDAARQASRSGSNRSTRSSDSESYRLGSYDPQDDRSQSSQSQRQRDQQRRTSSSYDSSRSSYDSSNSGDDWSDDSSTGSRSSDRSSQRNRSSSDDESSSYGDEDQSSSARSSNRSSSGSRSQDDSDSYNSSEE